MILRFAPGTAEETVQALRERLEGEGLRVLRSPEEARPILAVAGSVPASLAAELRALQALAQAGLVALDAKGIQVSDTGWFFVRAIAMVFDSYLQDDLSRERFSRIL